MTYYHGTRRGFTRGGILLPRRFHGGPGTTAPLNPGETPQEDAADYVYVTTDPLIAWVYAMCASGRARPRVLTVRPIGEVERDPEHSASVPAYRCEAAKVLSVDFNAPITEAEARDGWQVPA